MKALANKIEQQRIEVKKRENLLKVRVTSRIWSIYASEREKLIELLEKLES